MADQFIVCPKCGNKFRLTEAVTHEIEERIRRQFEGQEKKLKDQHEAELKTQQKEFEEKLKQERESCDRQAKKRAEEAVAVEIKDLKEQLRAKHSQTEDAQKKEVALRKRLRELEEKDQQRELEMERKLEGEIAKIWDQATKATADKHRLKDAEKDKQMAELRAQIEELKRKTEQSPPELQGEILESFLENSLRSNFPNDLIEPISRGVRGADVSQRIRNEIGEVCGSILWEAKRVKNWNDAWVQKLKDDQREAKADAGAIVAISVPEEVTHVGLYKEVWVADVQSAVGLATALREGLIQLAQARRALVGKNSKMEAIYSYLSGPGFRQRVEAIVEAFVALQQDLNAEKRAMEKVWAKRERQLTRVLENTSGMYGDLQGLIGASLPELKVLELPAADQGES